MTKLEKHRKIWQGKSDEWLFERLALELKDKVETIHNLLAENEQLRIASVSQQRELLITAFKEADRTGYIELLTNAKTIADKVISGNL